MEVRGRVKVEIKWSFEHQVEAGILKRWEEVRRWRRRERWSGA